MTKKKKDLTEEELKQVQGGATASSQSTGGQSSQQLGNVGQFGKPTTTAGGTIECPAGEIDVAKEPNPQQKG